MPSLSQAEQHPRPIVVRFIYVFVPGFWKTVKSKVIDAVLVVCTLAFLWVSGRLSFHAWRESVWVCFAPWVLLLCVIVVWHAFDSAHILSGQIKQELLANASAVSPIILPSGVHATPQKIGKVPYYRIRIYGIAFLILGIFAFLAYPVLRTILKAPMGHGLQPTASLPPTERHPAEPEIKPKPTRPSPLVKLLFDERTPLFTPERRRRITDEVDSFYRYLTNVGFDLSPKFPLLLLSPEKGHQTEMGFTTPGSVYSATIQMPQGDVDDPDKVINLYALWIFHTRFGSSSSVAEASMASLFSCYYRSSFTNSYVCPHAGPEANWMNALWEIRRKRGKEFSDTVMFYTSEDFQTNHQPPKAAETFDSFFSRQFAMGLGLISFQGQHTDDVKAILRNHQLYEK